MFAKTLTGIDINAMMTGVGSLATAPSSSSAPEVQV